MRYKEDFIAYLRFEKRFSPHTLLSYENDLRQFGSFLVQESEENSLPDPLLIRSWIISMMEDGKQPRTIHRKISSLRTYCKYLISRGILESNPADRVLKPKLRKGLPVFVEEEKIRLLLDTPEWPEGFEGKRDRFILELLYQTGMRRAELTALRLDSFQPQKNEILVNGKRGKQRLIPLLPSTVHLYNDYLRIREKNFAGLGREELFLTESGNPVYDKLIYRIVNRYLSRITTMKKKSPHVLRHTFATHLLNKGADLNAIKELLGHANLSATQVYTHNQFENLKNTYKKAHPRAD